MLDNGIINYSELFPEINDIGEKRNDRQEASTASCNI